MGREVRRVPEGWEHPRQRCPHFNGRQLGCSEARRVGDVKCYHPLFDRSFDQEATEWKQGFAAWESGADPNRAVNLNIEWWEWHGEPPNREYYRPEWPPETMTHYQMYETVSEGTPVTPVFATKAELVDYLVKHGEFGDPIGWQRENAEAFVEREWAPSMIISGGVIQTPRDMT